MKIFHFFSRPALIVKLGIKVPPVEAIHLKLFHFYIASLVACDIERELNSGSVNGET